MFLRQKSSAGGRSLKRKWTLRALVLAFGLMIGFGTAEILLRIVGISNPQMYEPDQFCASRLMPGFRGYLSKEGVAHVEINSFGFRDREWTVAKPQGVFRIAVIGDSYIEAAQVEREQMFGAQLEKLLNSQREGSQPQVEVLSFGVSGWGTAQALQALRHHVWQFDPDLVLLAFTSGNDVRNNSRKLEPTDCRPFFDVVDGELKLDDRFQQHPMYIYGQLPSTRLKAQIINSSRVLQVVQRMRQSWAERRQPSTRPQAPQGQEVGLDDEALRAPINPDWQAAWEITDRLLLEMNREITSRGKQFAVMTVTSGVQVHPDPQVRSAAAQKLGVDDLLYPDRHLESLAKEAGFTPILLTEQFVVWATEHHEYLHGFRNTALGTGHWNATGHHEAAEIAATTLSPVLPK